VCVCVCVYVSVCVCLCGWVAVLGEGQFDEELRTCNL
jgi:hypothetical protein